MTKISLATVRTGDERFRAGTSPISFNHTSNRGILNHARVSRWKLENDEKIYLLGTLRYLEGCVIISRGFAAESRAWGDYFSPPVYRLEFFLGTQMWSYCGDRGLLEDLRSWFPPWDRDETPCEDLTSVGNENCGMAGHNKFLKRWRFPLSSLFLSIFSESSCHFSRLFVWISRSKQRNYRRIICCIEARISVEINRKRDGEMRIIF